MSFQKGILVTNASLKQLLPYLKEKYSTETFQPQYILTRRLCQDILENLFSFLRSMGTHTHPLPVNLKNRLKLYILEKRVDHTISVRVNIEIDFQILHGFKRLKISMPDIVEDNELQDLMTKTLFLQEMTEKTRSNENMPM